MNRPWHPDESPGGEAPVRRAGQPGAFPGAEQLDAAAVRTAVREVGEHKRSVAIVIRNWANPDQLLLVRRPEDDDGLPGVWGLPAATLRDDETWADAGRRIGPEKLGVTLHVGRELNRGGRMRRGRTMEMRLLEATILRGVPTVPQTAEDMTQYTSWRWDAPEALRPGAMRGSLCCMLQLDLMEREERVRQRIREREAQRR